MLYSIEVCKFSRLNVLFSLVNTLIMLTYHGTEGGNYVKYRDNCLLHLNKFKSNQIKIYFAPARAELQQGRSFVMNTRNW